jgi:hypothetical protein
MKKAGAFITKLDPLIYFFLVGSGEVFVCLVRREVRSFLRPILEFLSRRVKSQLCQASQCNIDISNWASQVLMFTCPFFRTPLKILNLARNPN